MTACTAEKRRFPRWLRRLLLILAALAAALLLPRFFGYTSYAVLSGSMEPELPAPKPKKPMAKKE